MPFVFVRVMNNLMMWTVRYRDLISALHANLLAIITDLVDDLPHILPT